jgi:hypothetical protein
MRKVSLFDNEPPDRQADASQGWANKLIVAEAYDAPRAGDTGPDDLQRAEMQYRREGAPPVLFDDGDGAWGPRAEFARLMGADAETLTLEAAEAWLIQRLV